MPHVPDATTKYAFDLHPRPWLALAGLPVPPTDAGVTMVDPTMSTVSMADDKLVRVDDGVSPQPGVRRIPDQPRCRFDRRMLRYSVWAGRVIQRFDAEIPRVEAREMVEVVSVFLGLRLGADAAQAIMGSFSELLEESSTYQATLRKGEARGVQETLLALGEQRFGRPSDAVILRIRSQADVPKLRGWAARLLTADGWDQLLDG